MASGTFTVKTPCVSDDGVSYTHKTYNIKEFQSLVKTSSEDVERICRAHGLNRRGLSQNRKAIMDKLIALTVNDTTKLWLDKVTADLDLPPTKAATRSVVLTNLLASAAWKTAMRNVSNLSRPVPSSQVIEWTPEQLQRALPGVAPVARAPLPRRMDWSQGQADSSSSSSAFEDLNAILQRQAGTPSNLSSRSPPSTLVTPIHNRVSSEPWAEVSQVSGLLLDLAVADPTPEPTTSQHDLSSNGATAYRNSSTAPEGPTVNVATSMQSSGHEILDNTLLEELARLKQEVQQLRNATRPSDTVLFSYNQDLLKAAESKKQQDEIISKQADRIAELEIHHHRSRPPTPQNSASEQQQQLQPHNADNLLCDLSPEDAHTATPDQGTPAHSKLNQVKVEAANDCPSAMKRPLLSPIDISKITLLNLSDVHLSINRADDEAFAMVEAAAEKTTMARLARRQLNNVLTYEARKIADYEKQITSKFQSSIDNLMG